MNRPINIPGARLGKTTKQLDKEASAVEEDSRNLLGKINSYYLDAALKGKYGQKAAEYANRMLKRMPRIEHGKATGKTFSWAYAEAGLPPIARLPDGSPIHDSHPDCPVEPGDEPFIEDYLEAEKSLAADESGMGSIFNRPKSDVSSLRDPKQCLDLYNTEIKQKKLKTLSVVGTLIGAGIAGGIYVLTAKPTIVEDGNGHVPPVVHYENDVTDIQVWWLAHHLGPDDLAKIGKAAGYTDGIDVEATKALLKWDSKNLTAQMIYFLSNNATAADTFDKDFGVTLKGMLNYYGYLKGIAKYQNHTFDKSTLDEIVGKDPAALPDFASLKAKLNDTDALTLQIPDVDVEAYKTWFDTNGSAIGRAQLLTQQYAEYIESLATAEVFAMKHGIDTGKLYGFANDAAKHTEQPGRLARIKNYLRREQ